MLVPSVDRFRVRRAVSSDYAAVGQLTLDAYEHAGMIREHDAYAATLLDAPDRAAKAEVYVVEGSGGLLATVTLAEPGTPYAEFARPGELEFRMLAVAPTAQGLGLGTRLVAFCREQAAARGHHGLVLSVRDINVAALRLYERLGFQRQPERDQEPVPGVILLVLTQGL